MCSDLPLYLRCCSTFTFDSPFDSATFVHIYLHTTLPTPTFPHGDHLLITVVTVFPVVPTCYSDAALFSHLLFPLLPTLPHICDHSCHRFSLLLRLHCSPLHLTFSAHCTTRSTVTFPLHVHALRFCTGFCARSLTVIVCRSRFTFTVAHFTCGFSDASHARILPAVTVDGFTLPRHLTLRCTLC